MRSMPAVVIKCGGNQYRKDIWRRYRSEYYYEKAIWPLFNLKSLIETIQKLI